MTLRPDFYEDFACRAGSCRHSCCKGWEIDVDDDSAARYRRLPGPLGQRLRDALTESEEGFSFRLTPEERCPFLQKDGLCELICQLGEDALCEICRLHPRFYERWGDDLLCGLGLSCEEVCALLLAPGRGPLRFCTEDRSRSFSLPELLAQGMPDFPVPLTGWDLPRGDAPYYRRMLALFSCTEAIDGDWLRQLDSLSLHLDELLSALPGSDFRLDRDARERVLHYLLYRQLERIEDYGPARFLRYGLVCTDFIDLLALQMRDPAEALRRWSEQIEYSTENVDIIMEGVESCFER